MNIRLVPFYLESCPAVVFHKARLPPVGH